MDLSGILTIVTTLVGAIGVKQLLRLVIRLIPENGKARTPEVRRNDAIARLMDEKSSFLEKEQAFSEIYKNKSFTSWEISFLMKQRDPTTLVRLLPSIRGLFVENNYRANKITYKRGLEADGDRKKKDRRYGLLYGVTFLAGALPINVVVDLPGLVSRDSPIFQLFAIIALTLIPISFVFPSLSVKLNKAQKFMEIVEAGEAKRKTDDATSSGVVSQKHSSTNESEVTRKSKKKSEK